MNSNKNSGFLLILLIILLIWIWNLKSDIRDWEKRNKSLDDRVYSLNWDIMERDNMIDSLNSQIETAKIYTWSSYQDMGNALDNLHTE